MASRANIGSVATASRDEIIAFADSALSAPEFDDYGPNGLQVPGAGEVTRIVTGVSAHLALIERAVESGAGMLIAHHGLFWNKQPSALSPAMATRLRVALGADLNVAAYHLPLDADPSIGNNALLCDRLGLKRRGTFAPAGGRDIGVVCSPTESISPSDLTGRVARLLDREPLLLGDGPERVASIGIVSGGGAPFLRDAIRLGLDALITGEPAEQATAEAREGGIHFIAAGHHATERFGIEALGVLIAERFGIEHEFVDIPNPV